MLEQQQDSPHPKSKRKEEQAMVRIDLFHPVERSVFGTATAMDILHVCLAALLFCAAAAVIFSVATCALIWLVG
jgi:hypothetical protein